MSLVLTQRGTLVGIMSLVLTREAPWWVYYHGLHPERHPGGYISPYICLPPGYPGGYYTSLYALPGTLVGVYILPVHRPGTYLGWYTIRHRPDVQV